METFSPDRFSHLQAAQRRRPTRSHDQKHRSTCRSNDIRYYRLMQAWKNRPIGMKPNTSVSFPQNQKS